MNPEMPVLIINLQIAITPDTSAEELMAVIGQKLDEAFVELREHQADVSFEPDSAESAEDFAAPGLMEVLEGYTEDTDVDLLKAMGYTGNK